MKKTIIAMLIAIGMFCVHNTGEAMYYYLWCDTNHAYWLDGDSIKENSAKDMASGIILVEDMHTRSVSKYSENPCIVYKKGYDYYISVEGQDQDMRVDSYDNNKCWQPWVYKWMVECKHLVKE